MKRAIVAAVVLLGVWTTRPVFTQAEPPVDAKELAAVEKIRARIEEQTKKAPSAPQPPIS